MDSDYARHLSKDIANSVGIYSLMLKELRQVDDDPGFHRWLADARVGLRAMMKGVAETTRVLDVTSEPTGTSDDRVVEQALTLLRSILESLVLVSTADSFAALEKLPLLTERDIDERLSGSDLEHFLGSYDALPAS